jgi:hypothetical protein
MQKTFFFLLPVKVSAVMTPSEVKIYYFPGLVHQKVYKTKLVTEIYQQAIYVHIVSTYFESLEIFLFTTASGTALGPTQPLIQCVLGTLSLGVKRPRREVDHSLPSSAEVKE